MKLNKQDVEHIADLARIELTDDEKDKYVVQLGDILGYIEQLKEVNTDDVSPTTQITGLVNVVREDKIGNRSAEERKMILEDIPVKEGDYIKVKAVL